MSIFEVPLRGCDFCNGFPSDTVEALPGHLGGEYTDPETGEKVEDHTRQEDRPAEVRAVQRSGHTSQAAATDGCEWG